MAKEKSRVMNDDSQRRFEQAANRFGEATMKCIVPLFTDVRSMPVSVGTGFLVSDVRRHFLVTAAHVLDLVAKTDDGLYFHSAPNMKRRVVGRMARTTIPPGKTRDDDLIDTGVVELSGEGVPPYPKAGKFALKLDMLRPTTAHTGDRHLFTGFPSSKGRVNRVKHTLDSGAHSYLATPLNPAGYKDLGLSENMHIVLPYSPKKTVDLRLRKANFPKLNGMSGSPLFRLGPTRELGPQVVGVVTTYRPRYGIVIATSIAVARQMISGLGSESQSPSIQASP